MKPTISKKTAEKILGQAYAAYEAKRISRNNEFSALSELYLTIRESFVDEVLEHGYSFEDETLDLEEDLNLTNDQVVTLHAIVDTLANDEDSQSVIYRALADAQDELRRRKVSYGESGDLYEASMFHRRVSLIERLKSFFFGSPA